MARVFTSGLVEDSSSKSTDLNYQLDSEEEATDSNVSIQEISSHLINREVVTDSSEAEEGSTESDNNSVVYVGEKQKVRAMPSYTGAGRTSTYQQEQDLHHAAKDCKKITSFFTAVTKVEKLTSTAPEPITAITEPASPLVEEDHMPTQLPMPVSSSMLTPLPMSVSPPMPTPLSIPVPPSTPPSLSILVPPPTPPPLSIPVPPPTPPPLSVEEHHESILPIATGQVLNVTTFLDMAEDDDDASKPVSELESIKALITSAKRFKLFTSLFYLNAVKEFIKLWDKYKKNSQIKAPMIKASYAISTAIGKGPYMAWKIHKLYAT
ncbi:hypothetical protein BJV74DRAFT_883700 [Russula compacta]|nr:hypothetical protein BJV74DRAFT_883700 [Russula compacta]